MKWFDSDYNYIDEFTTQWNERYKKVKRTSIILSIVLILIGIHYHSDDCCYWPDNMGSL